MNTATRHRLRERASRLADRARARQNVHSLRVRGAQIGENVRLAQPTWIDPGFCWLITIGDNSILGPSVSVIAHDASTKRLTGYTVLRPVDIGKRVYIGASATILPGVTIGDDSIVGAASVVRGDVPAGVMVVGNPARVVADVSDYKKRHELAMENGPVWDMSGLDLLDEPDDSKDRMRDQLRETPGYVR